MVRSFTKRERILTRHRIPFTISSKYPLVENILLCCQMEARFRLNSASRLKFPVKFTGDSREVEVSGEAYFEIAKDKSKPFRVRFNNSTVEVLGTHFNVSAYENDQLQAVTLLEGSVKVLNPMSEVMIKPGEQARLSTSSTISVKQVDAEEAVAWKNGYFSFADEDIKSIMKKLARWYGFSAEYHGNVDNEHFGGMISRFKNISEVLSMFRTNRNYTIQTDTG